MVVRYKHTRKGALAAALVVLMGTSGCEWLTSEPASAGEQSPPSMPLDPYLGENAVSFDHVAVAVWLQPGRNRNRVHLPTNEEMEIHSAVQEKVSECMASLGFVYVPTSLSDMNGDDRFRDVNDLPEGEFIRTYGFGISTLRVDAFDARQNPNAEIRENLSVSEGEEYDKALYGDQPPSSFGIDEGDGCLDVAYAEVLGSNADLEHDPVITNFPSLMDDLFALGRRIREDPRLDAARQKWSECMADVGFEGVTEVDEPRALVEFVRDAVFGYDEGMDPRSPSEDEIRELQEFELSIAIAQFECRESEYNEVLYGVRREHESNFIEEHRAELERYREWASRQG